MAEDPSRHWLVEEGIGEHRAIRIEDGSVTAARLDWPGQLAPGHVADATLVARPSTSPRGKARFDGGEEALVDRLPRNASEGARLRLLVTRAALIEPGRTKLALARPTEETPRSPPSLAERLRETGGEVRIVRRFPVDEWPNIVLGASDGSVEFAGGAIVISPTPAMTLIDIDGSLAPRPLAEAAIPAIASAISRFDIGGSIGIDFPSIAQKQDRRAIDRALAEALGSWPHEATAMNGFGFVQLVGRLEGPSILQRVRSDRAGAAARLLLRMAEQVDEPGELLITAAPAVCRAIGTEWEAELARRTGRSIGWREDASLALFGGFAQARAT